MDLYKVLGVDRGASIKEIRRAYKKLARRYHPDVNPGDSKAENRFKQVSEAHAVLSNPEKRAAYDRFGAVPGDPGPDRGRRGGEGGFTAAGFDVGGAAGAAPFADLFAHIFGGGEPAPRGPRPGEDLEAVLRINFLEAVRGLTAPLTVTRVVACGDCRGRGSCSKCGGRGRVTRREKIELKVPAGVAGGNRLKMSGKGNVGEPGAAAGNLYVTIQVAPHEVFERRGDNIYVTVPVTVTEAALGTALEVPTVDGTSRVRLAPGTQTGQQLRLQGKGVPSLRGGRGDQFVEIRVLVPEARDEETRNLLRQLAARTPGAPREHLFGSKG